MLTKDKDKHKEEKQSKFSWRDIPGWIQAIVAIIGLFSAGFGGKVISEIQYQDEIQELQESREQKEKLDSEIDQLKEQIDEAQEEKTRLTKELNQAQDELAKPVTIDISNQRPVELILNRQLQPKGLSGIEMTLDKILVEKGVGMTFVFTTWNKNTQGYVNAGFASRSTITDNLGNGYGLLEISGPSKVSAGIKAEHKLRFPIPKPGANQLTVKIDSGRGRYIFDLSPFSITLPNSNQLETSE